MNDASNVIITNNQSDITRIKFGKMNNKISNIVNVSELVQKNNPSKSKSKTTYNNQNIEKNVNINKPKKLDSLRSKKLNTINNKKSKNKLESKNLNTSISFVEKNYFYILRFLNINQGFFYYFLQFHPLFLESF